MRKKTKIILLSLALCAFAIQPVVTSCKAPTAQRVTYNTLASIGSATDAAVKGYFDAVVHGTVKTNGVPAVAKAYSNFQLAFGTALVLANNDTNAVVSSGVATASAAVTAAIAAGR